MPHTRQSATTSAQEAQALRNTTRTRRQPTAAALAAKAKLAETMARMRAEGNFPQSVLQRHGLTK